MVLVLIHTHNFQLLFQDDFGVGFDEPIDVSYILEWFLIG